MVTKNVKKYFHFLIKGKTELEVKINTCNKKKIDLNICMQTHLRERGWGVCKKKIKTRYLLKCSFKQWGELRKSAFTDEWMRTLLKSNQVTDVRISARKKKLAKDGTIIINFITPHVRKDSEAIHCAKSNLCKAVQLFSNAVAQHVSFFFLDCTSMYTFAYIFIFVCLWVQGLGIAMHTCQWDGCSDIVVRDTEGYCSRHRQQKYHKERDTGNKMERKNKKVNVQKVQQRNVENATFNENDTQHHANANANANANETVGRDVFANGCKRELMDIDMDSSQLFVSNTNTNVNWFPQLQWIHPNSFTMPSVNNAAQFSTFQFNATTPQHTSSYPTFVAPTIVPNGSTVPIVRSKKTYKQTKRVIALSD
ncbi:hypothetical protein RFI_25627 [Reticulomyxa filosa]|uniref:Uncharacterized protein n=1 Tax=Reticulomyxa filosa TaxID=46433 RepID=X6MCX9_RETFI|nr:hypothetical protein RFI_25627 [Reticulomyxa filosa]|eukprot:ETO11749.1 hypothetical protein RFI_25627 [Reticulomyxa filosa]